MSNPKWLQIAQKYKGVKEWRGSRHNPTVMRFFAKAGFPGIKTDETPWCAAFANAVMDEAGLPETGKLTARSFLNWGQKIDKPAIGAVVIFRRGNSSWQGHVGFVVGWTRTHIQVLGGNQSNMVNIASYPRSKLLGFRWPAGQPLPGHEPIAIPDDAPTLRVTGTPSLNVRTAPKSAGGDVLTSINDGSVYPVFETWHRIQTPRGTNGWVSGKFSEVKGN